MSVLREVEMWLAVIGLGLWARKLVRLPPGIVRLACWIGLLVLLNITLSNP